MGLFFYGWWLWVVVICLEYQRATPRFCTRRFPRSGYEFQYSANATPAPFLESATPSNEHCPQTDLRRWPCGCRRGHSREKYLEILNLDLFLCSCRNIRRLKIARFETPGSLSSERAAITPEVGSYSYRNRGIDLQVGFRRTLLLQPRCLIFKTEFR